MELGQTCSGAAAGDGTKKIKKALDKQEQMFYNIITRNRTLVRKAALQRLTIGYAVPRQKRCGTGTAPAASCFFICF